MRLIDADKLPKYTGYALSASDVAIAVENAPTVAAVPVVRCKDCRYSYDDMGGLCCSHGVCVDCVVPEDFFCSHGERKGGDNP